MVPAGARSGCLKTGRDVECDVADSHGPDYILRMNRRALLLVSLACPLLLAWGCEHHRWDDQSDLIVINGTGCDLTIFVDSHEVFVVRDHSTKSLEDIGEGRHDVEARDERGQLVERRTIHLDEGEDYYWRIDHCD